MPIAKLDSHPRPIKILFLTHRGHLFLLISTQILMPFAHRPLHSNPCAMVIHLTMRLGALNPLNSLQFPTPHRPLRSKINPVTVVLHLEVVTMATMGLKSLQTPTSFLHSKLGKVVLHLGVLTMGLKPLQINLLQVSQLEMVILRLKGFDPFQIPTSFNHRLLRSNLLRIPTSHRPLRIKMITMRLKGLNPLSSLQIYMVFAHRLHRGKVIRIGVGMIIYVEEIRGLLTIYHQFTKINKDMAQWLSYTWYHYLFYKYQTMLFYSCTKKEFVMYLITGPLKNLSMTVARSSLGKHICDQLILQ